jgi:PAT family beta-lactamase induction signal transducer AmpG
MWIFYKIFNKELLRRLATALTLGVNSGIVYAFLVSTTTAYLKDSGLPLTVIGFFSISTMPFSLKYFWSPFLDNYKLKLLPVNFGQRKSWILVMQFFLFLSIASFGFIDITKNMSWALALLVLIGFLGATSDISLEAYRIELFSKKESGMGYSLVVYGFRIGFIISGIFGLWLSSKLPWKDVFIVIAAFILPCMVIIAISPDKKILQKNSRILSYKKWVLFYFWEPIKEFTKLPNFMFVLLVIAFYKVSDAYLDSMSLPFLMDIGFSKSEIAGIAKTCSMFGAIVGTLIGGILITKLELKINLLLAETLAAITNLQFLIFLKVEKSLMILGVINFIESLSYGISNITLITYMSSLCSKKFTATHYAILISISAFSKGLLSPTSGFVAENFGWQNFFVISSMFSIPSIFCIYLLYWHKNNRASVI